MRPTVLRSRHINIWQILFLLAGSTWLAAPLLNLHLSHRLTLVSTFELPSQPYSWLFRLFDALAALLLIYATSYLLNKYQALSRYYLYGLLALGIAMLLDPLFVATCHLHKDSCQLVLSTSLIIHAAETIVSVGVVLVLSLYDAFKKKSLPSSLFVVWQITSVILVATNAIKTYQIRTLIQLVYEALVLVWVAWLLGELSHKVADKPPIPSSRALQVVRWGFAIWAYLNGIVAILVSLAHIHLLGFIQDFYFAGTTAWLAQHGVVIGVAMLYISRHLARGEHRARQLFLVLLFGEIIKYAAISPDIDLLILYGVTFVLLFSLRAFFQRGSVAPDWHTRLQETAVVLSGIAGSVAVVAFFVSRNHRLYRITHAAIVRFPDVDLANRVPHRLLRSTLLAHTFTTLIIATLAILLWSLFRPTRPAPHRNTQADRERVRTLLDSHATTSEDFFKVWPQDKQYYWSVNKDAFIAYTIVNSLVFALADPIGETLEQRVNLLNEFVQTWHDRGYTTCFLLISEASQPLYEEAGLNLVQIGSSAVITIEDFMSEAYNDKWWRWQKNRSTKAGYTYHRATPPHSSKLVGECRAVSRAWLSRPGHRERGFALGTLTEAYLQMCDLHYLTDDTGQVIAFANQPPSFPKLNQATVDMMRFYPDRNNTMPFLLGSTIACLAEDAHFSHFDLGFVPLAKIDNPLIAVAKTLASRQISAAGLEQFKGKFKPDWQKNYLAYDGDLGDLATIALRVDDAMDPK